MTELTVYKVADAVRAWQDEHGYSPSVLDVAIMLNRSVSTTHYWLKLAKERRLVDWKEGYQRTLRAL